MTLIIHFMHTSALKYCHARTLSNEIMFKSADQPIKRQYQSICILGCFYTVGQVAVVIDLYVLACTSCVMQSIINVLPVVTLNFSNSDWLLDRWCLGYVQLNFGVIITGSNILQSVITCISATGIQPAAYHASHHMAA